MDHVDQSSDEHSIIRANSSVIRTSFESLKGDAYEKVLNKRDIVGNFDLFAKCHQNVVHQDFKEKLNPKDNKSSGKKRMTMIGYSR